MTRNIRYGLIAVIVAVSMFRADPMAVRYVAFEQVTINNTAGGVGFTALKLSPNGSGTDPQATSASCRLETAQIRYTVDGTAPTTAVGTLLEVGDPLLISGNDLLRAFRGIRTGASSGVLDCTYFQP